ncbi:hypothetical protein KF840_17970 [bacterium]|nr:hypothetical protein [bacterium]
MSGLANRLAASAATIRALVRVLTCAGVVGWWLWAWPPSQNPEQWTDSWFYAGPGAWSFLRPWPTVLFWKTVGITPYAVYALHTLSVLCWARLGWVSAGPLGVAAALTISGTDLVRSWNFTVLSEPLAISGLAWLAAETVELRDRDNWRRRLLWLAAAVLATTRVATAPLVLPAAVAAVAWRRSLLWMLPVAFLLAAAPIVQQHHYPEHEREQAANLAAFRVGQVPALLSWMQQRGMPWPLPERWANVMYPNRAEMRNDAEALVDYIEGPFYPVYQRFLLAHPEYTARTALCIGMAQPPQTLYPNHGIPECDAWWKEVGAHVGYFTCLILALMVEPWAGIASLLMPVLTYHANVNELERLNAVTWAWTWMVALLLVRAGLRWMRHAAQSVRAYRSARRVSAPPR